MHAYYGWSMVTDVIFKPFDWTQTKIRVDRPTETIEKILTIRIVYYFHFDFLYRYLSLIQKKGNNSIVLDCNYFTFKIFECNISYNASFLVGILVYLKVFNVSKYYFNTYL